MPHSSLPPSRVLALIASALAGSARSFRADAAAAVKRMSPPLQVHGREWIPRKGPCVLVANHYSRPGFHAWWWVLSVSSVVPLEVRWIITEAWTGGPSLFGRAETAATRWAFRRVARAYGFLQMPPMPPRPEDAARRAEAVREAVAYARSAESPVIGLAPEGQDAPGGVLQLPPPGAGRFLLLLAAAGLQVSPVGIYEEPPSPEMGSGLHLRFGPPVSLRPPPGLEPAERDRWAACQAMERIADLLPTHLRGAFA